MPSQWAMVIVLCCLPYSPQGARRTLAVGMAIYVKRRWAKRDPATYSPIAFVRSQWGLPYPAVLADTRYAHLAGTGGGLSIVLWCLALRKWQLQPSADSPQ